jgi:hypothetical protein
MKLRQLHNIFNRCFDKLVRSEVQIRHRSVSAFQVCGYAGYTLAIVLGVILVTNRGLSLWVMGGLVLASALTFLALAMATKIIVGEERLIYYHHEIAIMVVATLLLWVWRQPILPYLDVVILGIGLFLVCGRVGCLMVGCCHGRPHQWGVCYRKTHVDAGFTPYFVGIRLFPIQAVESLWVLVTVAVGTILVLNGFPPGEALAWYVVVYDIGRFCFELMRGDPTRPYFLGFSEGQWISLFLMGIVVSAELSGLLTFHPWHFAATVCMVFLMVAITFSRRKRGIGRYQLLHPHHVKEIADTVGSVPAIPEKTMEVLVGCTSLGILISAGTIKGPAGPVHHYTLSCRDRIMTEDSAKIVAGVIRQFKHFSGPSRIIKREGGVFHILAQ